MRSSSSEAPGLSHGVVAEEDRALSGSTPLSQVGSLERHRVGRHAGKMANSSVSEIDHPPQEVRKGCRGAKAVAATGVSILPSS